MHGTHISNNRSDDVNFVSSDVYRSETSSFLHRASLCSENRRGHSIKVKRYNSKGDYIIHQIFSFFFKDLSEPLKCQSQQKPSAFFIC